jgi:hypothetical protein
MESENWTEWFPTQKGKENEALFSELDHNDEVMIQGNFRKPIAVRVVVSHHDYLLVKKPGSNMNHRLTWNNVLHYRRRIIKDGC